MLLLFSTRFEAWEGRMARGEVDDACILANHWSPPAKAGARNVDPGEPLACVATTYSFEAPYLEQELLPRFLGLEFDSEESGRSFLVEREQKLQLAQVVVLVDQCHYDPRQSSATWLQLPVCVPGGVLHAKVTLLIWERFIRAIVASANLTKPGYRRHREVATVLDFHDSEEAAPRVLLTDILAFLKAIRSRAWVRAGDDALSRLDEALVLTDRHRGWRSLRSDFLPRELPRCTFAPTLPTATGRRVEQSPLTIAKQMWGSRTADHVTVVTPFVGEPAASAEKAIVTLREAFPQRATLGHLAVPGQEIDRHVYTTLPESFWRAWKANWNGRGQKSSVWVVQPHDAATGVARPLHAKGLVVENADVILALCGSSNFSIHGMGVDAANVEANVCFLDHRIKRGGLFLYDRLGVDWDNDRCDDAQWRQEAEPNPEDAPASTPPLPRFFRWAKHDEINGILTIACDLATEAPAHWEVFLRSGNTGQPEGSVLARASEATIQLDGIIVISERAELKDRRITALLIEWDESGEGRRTAILPVQVEIPEPARCELTEGLTAQAIIDCLVADSEPARWIARNEIAEGRRKKAFGADADDAHKAVDVSRYPLYRVRWFGQALGVLAKRIASAPPAATYIRHRLCTDLLSPVQLARALRKEWRESSSDPTALGALCFSLAELRLTVAHAFTSLAPKDQRSFAALFGEALGAIGETGLAGEMDSSLRVYIDAVGTECRRLVPVEAAS
jgi:hypothetical protein